MTGRRTDGHSRLLLLTTTDAKTTADGFLPMYVALLASRAIACNQDRSSPTLLLRMEESTRSQALNAPPPEWDRILIACQKNLPDSVRDLIEKEGVSSNHKNFIGQSALHVAALWGHTECCSILLEHGADPHAQNTVTGATPLHACVQSAKAKTRQAKLDCIDLLIEKGANPSMGDFYGSIPFDYCEPDDFEMLTKLKPTKPPIFEAILTDNLNPSLVERVKDLVEASPSLVQDRYLTMTPLLKTVQDMCDTYDQIDDGKETKECFYEKQEIRFEIVKVLLEAGADAKQVPTIERHGHQFPADNPEPDCLERICTKLADAYRSNSAESVAIFSRTAQLLIQHGATVSDSEATSQLLHDAARRSMMDAVKFWINELGVDPNTKGRQGMTPLQFAARSGKVEIVKFLLSQETIDISLADDRGQTPLNAAKANQKDDIVKLLEDHQKK